MKTFAEQMADLSVRMRQAGITAAELADEAGVSETSLSRYANGHQQPLVDAWASIVNALERLIERRISTLQEMKQ